MKRPRLTKAQLASADVVAPGEPYPVGLDIFKRQAYQTVLTEAHVFWLRTFQGADVACLKDPVTGTYHKLSLQHCEVIWPRVDIQAVGCNRRVVRPGVTVPILPPDFYAAKQRKRRTSSSGSTGIGGGTRPKRPRTQTSATSTTSSSSSSVPPPPPPHPHFGSPPGPRSWTRSWFYPPEGFFRRAPPRYRAGGGGPGGGKRQGPHRLSVASAAAASAAAVASAASREAVDGTGSDVYAQRRAHWAAWLRTTADPAAVPLSPSVLDAVQTPAQWAAYPYKHLLRMFYAYFCGPLLAPRPTDPPPCPTVQEDNTEPVVPSTSGVPSPTPDASTTRPTPSECNPSLPVAPVDP